MNFKEFFNLCEFATNLDAPLGTVIPASIPFGATDSGLGQTPPQDDVVRRNELQLDIPSVTVTGRISSIIGPGQQQQNQNQQQDGRKNIIQITISGDSNKTTHLLLNWHEFKRKHLIKGGELRVGNTVTVVFQRHPSDTSRTPSQIQSITVH